jgi:hypothetical protein
VVRVDRNGTTGTAERALQIDGVTIFDQAAPYDTTEGWVVLDHQHTHERPSSHTLHEPEVKRCFTAGS